MRRKHCKQSVNKYSLHGEYICTYDSISDAERKTGIPNTNISSCCNKKTHTAGGYIWRFADDNEYVKQFLNKHYKSVLQIDKNTNEVICIYSSISKASEETGINQSSISACCRCIRKSAGGYIWRYADEIENNTLEEIVNE